MMRQSQLQLEHYHFLRLIVETDEAYSQTQDHWDYPNFSNVVFESSIAFGVPSDDSELRNHYSIKLKLNCFKPDDEDHSFPYTFETEVEGFFSVHENADSPEDLVKVNGTSILYGAIRDTLLTTTSRFVNGPIMLPTVNFLELKESKKTT